MSNLQHTFVRICQQVVEEEVVGLKPTSFSGSCGEASGATSLLVLLPRGAEEKGLFSHPRVWFTTRLQPTLLQLQNYNYNLHRTCRNALEQQCAIISGCATARTRRAACWTCESGRVSLSPARPHMRPLQVAEHHSCSKRFQLLSLT
jgi:hypothetical protein